MEKKYHFHNVSIVPIPTEIQSRSEVNLEVSYITKHSKRLISGTPVIVANMDTVGTPNMALALYKHGFWVALHKFIKHTDLEENNHRETFDTIYSRCFLTSGIETRSLYTTILSIKSYSSKFRPNICLDVANGYMYKFLDTIKEVRNLYPDSIIMAGNVCTPEGVENIIKAGADIVKCGIAQGGVCDTKNKAGVGYPQFSVAQECGQAANELEGLCCSDGGIKTPADICKALAAGSHFVMAGSIFAGYDECDAEWEYNEDGTKKRMKLYGMSSEAANDKYCGGLKEYRTSEGIEKWVEYKGSVDLVAQNIRGSLASCCSYCNTSNLENLKKNAEFVLT